MLLKISDGAGGWHIFDDVENVHLDGTKKTIRHRSDLDDLNNSRTINLVAVDAIDRNQSLVVGVLIFEREKVKKRAIVTDAVYICNSAGDTVDVIRLR